MDYTKFFMQYSKIKENIDFIELKSKSDPDFIDGKGYLKVIDNEMKKQYMFHHRKNETSTNYLYLVEFTKEQEEYWTISFLTLESKFDQPPSLGESGTVVFVKIKSLIFKSGLKKLMFVSTPDKNRPDRLKTARDRIFESALAANDVTIKWKEIMLPRRGLILVGYFEIT